MYDNKIGRWLTQDPLSEKYYAQSQYNYCVNNPLSIIDPNGKDTVLVQDIDVRPRDNGKGDTYTAIVEVIQNGKIIGQYRGSTYPNSISISDNRPRYNTIKEGEYNYSNKYGHIGETTGVQKGLNIVDEDGNRKVPGTKPDGTDVVMTYVNVHRGYSNNKGPSSRGSKGCITIHPEDADLFFTHFIWSKDNDNTGSSVGKIIIKRNLNKME